jgi:MFS family permease
MRSGSHHWSVRLPFYYGWLIVGVAFVTMAIGVTARTAFSLLLPPLIDEFGWDRGLAAGAFSFGFLVLAVLSPVVGRVMDARGPRLVIMTGVALLSLGFVPCPLYRAAVATLCDAWRAGRRRCQHDDLHRPLAVPAELVPAAKGPRHQYRLCRRRRHCAPALAAIDYPERRLARLLLGILVVLAVAPLNLLVRKKPEDLGLMPDGEARPASASERHQTYHVLDPAWVAIEWTLARAARTTRFWWIVLGYFCALVAWYAVQVHQTKYLTEIGFTPLVAAWALGAVSVAGIPGQIILGGLSDRIGREWLWTAGCDLEVTVIHELGVAHRALEVVAGTIVGPRR